MSDYVQIKGNALAVGAVVSPRPGGAAVALFHGAGNIELSHAEADRLRIAVDEVRGRYLERLFPAVIPSTVERWPVRFAVKLPDRLRAQAHTIGGPLGFGDRLEFIEAELAGEWDAVALATALEDAAAKLRGIRAVQR